MFLKNHQNLKFRTQKGKIAEPSDDIDNGSTFVFPQEIRTVEELEQQVKEPHKPTKTNLF